MATEVTTNAAEDTAPVPDLSAMNSLSMKGWKFFTNFLLWNVVSIIAVLIVVGLLTVWS